MATVRSFGGRTTPLDNRTRTVQLPCGGYIGRWHRGCGIPAWLPIFPAAGAGASGFVGSHASPGRPRKVFVRLSKEQFAQVEAAAESGSADSGQVCREVTVAAARAAAAEAVRPGRGRNW
jgi:hypothetical protein